MNYLNYEDRFQEDCYFIEQMKFFSDEILEFRDLYNYFLRFSDKSEIPQDWLSLAKQIHSREKFTNSEFLQMLYAQSILNALEFEEDCETAMTTGNSITGLPLFQQSEKLQVQFAISMMKCLELSYDSNENIILEKFRSIPCFNSSKIIHCLCSDFLKILIDRTPAIKEKLMLAEYFHQIPSYPENIELQRIHAEVLMETVDITESLQEGKKVATLIKSIPHYGKVDDISVLYCQSLIHLLSLDNSDVSNSELIEEIFSLPGFNDSEMLQHAMVDQMKKSIDEDSSHEDILKILETTGKLSLLNEVEVIQLQYLDLMNYYSVALARKGLFGDTQWMNILKIYDKAMDLPAVYPYETANVAAKFIRLFKSLQDINRHFPDFQTFRGIMEKWLKNAAEREDSLKLRMMGAGISYARTMLPPEKQREIEELTCKYCREHQELFNNIDSLWNTFVDLNH